MLKPDKKNLQAIRGLEATAPGFYQAYVEYLEDARDHERNEMEQCPRADTEVAKGKCRMLTEQINLLQSLIPKGGN